MGPSSSLPLSSMPTKNTGKTLDQILADDSKYSNLLLQVALDQLNLNDATRKDCWMEARHHCLVMAERYYILAKRRGELHQTILALPEQVEHQTELGGVVAAVGKPAAVSFWGAVAAYHSKGNA